MSVEVALTTVWLNLASNLSDYQTFPAMSKLEINTKRPGEARLNANGRTRLIRKTSNNRTFSLDLPICTRAQIDWLELHVGELMLVRDDRKRKVWCVYFDVPVTETSADTDSGDVNLSLVEITYSEAV